MPGLVCHHRAVPEIAPWWLVLPLKAPAQAKRRLTPPPGVVRAELARAMAADTLDAAVAAVGRERVVIVGEAPDPSSGYVVLADEGRGLNAAVHQGISWVHRAAPGPVAVYFGDHPCVHADDLRQALAGCERHPRAVVPDADGSGTALLTARDASDLTPQFGPESAAAHGRSAATVLLDLPRLRLDVDDAASLSAAVALGVGRRTAAVLAQAGH